jgi:hypothetical protein
MCTLRRLLWLVVFSVAIAAGSAHSEKTAERSASPLIGTWTRAGDTPSGAGAGADSGPQFTKLTFAADGSLGASYVAGGIGALVGSAPAVKSENDTYTIAGDSKLSIAEGTTHRDYGYRVSGSKLYLTPPDGGTAAVFTKAG